MRQVISKAAQAFLLGLVIVQPAGLSAHTTPPEPRWKFSGEMDSDCVWSQSVRWSIDPVLLLAIIRQEGIAPGACAPNRNGTCDIGPLGINNRPAALQELARHMGYPHEDFTYKLHTDACFNVGAGAAMLRKKINEAGGDVWKGVAWYNSRTPHVGAAYASKVAVHYLKIDRSLKGLNS